MNTERLHQQIAFILEIDKLKSILRRSYLVNDPRHENSAEHSWHLAIMAMLLAEHANAEVHLLRVLKMLLVHDVVEIDAGDTYCYDASGNAGKAAREQAAAQRIFGLLPSDQRDEMHQLWEEFEARETPEARFAAALDRLMPMLHNYHTQGRSWLEHGITSTQVRDHNRHMEEGADALWRYAEAMIKDAVSLEPVMNFTVFARVLFVCLHASLKENLKENLKESHIHPMFRRMNGPLWPPT